MSKQKTTYTEAVTELEKILADLENNAEVDMEQISGKVKRAAELLNICKKQLHEIDAELEKMLDELD
ncbi:Exonuclease VII small subunit [uncultured Paludibacter sp.]|nr:Exonuclease VII small subunit [uncultured Paludibacter sp.]